MGEYSYLFGTSQWVVGIIDSTNTPEEGQVNCCEQRT